MLVGTVSSARIERSCSRVFEPTPSAFGDCLLETYRMRVKASAREGVKSIQRLVDGRYVLRFALEISVTP